MKHMDFISNPLNETHFFFKQNKTKQTNINYDSWRDVKLCAKVSYTWHITHKMKAIRYWHMVRLMTSMSSLPKHFYCILLLQIMQKKKNDFHTFSTLQPSHGKLHSNCFNKLTNTQSHEHTHHTFFFQHTRSWAHFVDLRHCSNDWCHTLNKSSPYLF